MFQNKSVMTSKSEKYTFPAFSVIVVFVLLCLIGLASIPFISVQLFPSRSFASVTIQANLYGASTEVTESEITVPIEAVVSRLKGITKISSNSQSGNAWVRIELDKYTDPEMFRFESATVLKQLYPKLPKNAGFPSVYLNRPDDNTYQSPILGYTLIGPGSANEIAMYAEQVIQPSLADISGIYRVDVSGKIPSQIAVYLDPEKMNVLRLSASDVRNTVSTALQKRELGIVHLEQDHYALYLDQRVDNLETLQHLPIKTHQERIFTLSDIAVIVENDQKRSGYYRINGQEQVRLSVFAEDNVNTIQIAAKVRKRLQKVENQLPPEYSLSLQYDDTTHIKEELNKIYLRTFLSVAILILFVLLITRNIRYLIIVLFALAANVLLSCILYYLIGLDLHMYSLAGITISLGLVIDNVIVIVEDIRHTGRNRIFAAILASTLTALGAISVIFLLSDEQRVNLLDFGIAIIINLLVSLPIAYFLIPSLLEKMPIYIKKTTLMWHRRRTLVMISRLYKKQLRFMVRWKWCFAVLFILVFGLPVFLLPKKIENNESFGATVYNKTLGSDWYNRHLRDKLNVYLGGTLYDYISNQGTPIYLHQGEEEAVKQTQLYVNIKMPMGATLDQMDAICRGFENFVGQHSDHLDFFTASVSGGTEANLQIVFKKDVASGIPYQMKNILERQAILSGAADFSVHGVGRGFNNAVNQGSFDSAILLKGYNYQQLQELALIVRDSLLVHKRVNNVLVSARREYGESSNYEHVLRFQRPELLTLNRVGRYAVSDALMRIGEESGSTGLIKVRNQQEQEVHIYYNQERNPDVWSAMQLPLAVNDSTFIRLENVAHRSRINVGSTMVRENQEYAIYINYRFIGTAQLNQIVNERVVKSIAPLLPFGYSVKGQSWDGWGEQGANYLWYIPLILLIIYMICAVLLESLKQPLAVILIIPFSFIGVFLTFRFLGLRFDQGGYAALLMLSGLVTNAALYIVNDLNFLKKNHSNYSSYVAVQEYVKAFHAKAMPIIVTTASAILSLLPFMIIGEEKGFWFTLSAGTIGGLVFSLLGVYLMLPLCLVRRKKV